jgi:hypothetical protein
LLSANNRSDSEFEIYSKNITVIHHYVLKRHLVDFLFFVFSIKIGKNSLYLQVLFNYANK